MYEDTIAAIATAMGEGGIGIVRISGDDALPILEKIFTNFKKIEVNKLTYGKIKDNFTGEIIDEVMACYMKAPHSYTAEDVCEIQCHGSIVSLRKILALVLKNGAKLADRGEFTKRAFLNGRLDLSQAEAVIDLIRAKSDKTFDVALDKLSGRYSEKIKEIRKGLVDILVNITVNIDYPDEDIEVLTFEKLGKDIKNSLSEIEKMLMTADTGRLIQEGLAISIIGKPNVGKSSLMNALLNETRAIVTSIPGTTRDTIEEAVTIKNIPVKLTDTAGIRETDDVIEKIGIEKSKEAFNRADLILFILDGSSELCDEDFEIMDYIGSRKAFAVINKIDLESKIDKEEIKKRLPNAKIIETSATQNMGISSIEDEIEEMVYGGKVSQGDSMLVTNVRHKNLLEESAEALRDALHLVEIMEPLEVLEIDVNRAYELTGQIIGESVGEDILNEVFQRFCLGK